MRRSAQRRPDHRWQSPEAGCMPPPAWAVQEPEPGHTPSNRNRRAGSGEEPTALNHLSSMGSQQFGGAALQVRSC